MGCRMRLRELPDLAETYTKPHDARAYGHGHHLRVEQTKAVVRWIAAWQKVRHVADFSCGNGEIPSAVLDVRPDATILLGDYAPGYPYDGPLDKHLTDLFLRNVELDLYTCCETLEHLPDPASTLERIYCASRLLVLSTPVNNWGDENGEHLWAWNRGGVEDLLRDTAWVPVHYSVSDTRPLDGVYTYGIWVCHRNGEDLT